MYLTLNKILALRCCYNIVHSRTIQKKMKGKILIIGRRTVISREEKMKIQETTIIFSLPQLRSFNLKEYDFQKNMKFNIIGTEQRSRESSCYIILLYDEFLIFGIENSGWFLVPKLFS